MIDLLKKYNYSDDDVLSEAIQLIENGEIEEEIQEKLNLSNDDLDLIDFIINEF